MPAQRLFRSRPMMALALTTASPSCSPRVAQPDQCALEVLPTQSNPVGAREAAVYWDISKSMSGFTGTSGALTLLNSQIESDILQSNDVAKVRHYTIAESLTELGVLPSRLRLNGSYSNLPQAFARAAATFVDSDAPPLSIVVSDLLVAIPPKLRRQANPEICGATVPVDRGAPYLVEACVREALGRRAYPVEGWTSVVRFSTPTRSLYAVIMSRSYDTGAAVHRAMLSMSPSNPGEGAVILAQPHQITLADASNATCRFDPNDSDTMLMSHRDVGMPTCRFRFRTANTTHSMNCSLPAISQLNSAITVQSHLVSRGEEALSTGTDWYAVSTQAGSSAQDQPIVWSLRYALPDQARAGLLAFADNPDTGKAILSLADALADGLRPPPPPSWRVQYQGP